MKIPFGIINGMTVTVQIDQAGRIVLPKKVRERLRLHAGAQLSIEEGPDGVVLRPVERRASLQEEGGILVHVGQAPAHFDWNRVVEDHREERLEDLAGL